MSKRQFAVGFLFIFIFCAGLATQKTDSEQIHTDINKANIVEEWQINPEAFAKLFFGNDLRVRSPSKGVTILRENAERVKGSRVEWTFTFGISPSWLILSKEIQVKTRLGNPALYHKIGPDVSGWIDLTDGSRFEGLQKMTWMQMTWRMPPQCAVHLKMKLEYVLAMILKNGMLHIGVEGTELEIETASKRCGWPEYKAQISDPLSSSYEIRVINAHEFPVKVGLRSDDKGVDFIAPAKGQASVLVPGGEYNAFFQYAADPESLYQGDSLHVLSSGVEIRLMEAGDYNIRKVKQNQKGNAKALK